MLGVVRRNPQFLRLWLAQVVSQGGDWMSRMAVLALIGELGGPGAVAGLGALFGTELAVRLLPAAVFGPLAGPLADRLPRRRLMVATDLLRCGLVLGLLSVRERSHLPVLFVLVLAQMSLAHFFNAARSASIPNTVPRAELHEAQALSAVTWSSMLTVGALAGGLLLVPLGVGGVLVLDAATYLVSAALLAGLRLPDAPEHAHPFRWREVLWATELRRGVAHVRSLGLGPAVLAKTCWGGAGGFLVMLPVVAGERFAAAGPEGEGSALGLGAGALGFATGMLYVARGVGTGLGPVLARWRLGSSDRALARQISAGFAIGAAGYALFAFSSSFVTGLLCVAFAHAGGSALWVASTVLWQRRVDDAYQGRVFALEFLGLTLAFSLGGLGAGWLYDATGSSVATLLANSGAVLAAGALWWGLARRLWIP